MIIKEFDDFSRQQDILELNALLKLPYLSESQKTKISQQIRKIHSGIKGEKEAVYQINFHFRPSKNWAVIHDLRLEFEGNVAQIDHLLINRMMEIYICESKYFNEGITINEHGECTMYYQGKPRGIPSPIEQNNHHKLLLQRLFKSDEINFPTRLGMKMKPFSYYNMILVGSSAIIRRPKNNKDVEDLDRIIKNDQLYKRINKDTSSLNPKLFLQQAASLIQVISPETLENFAENLAALHKPIKKTDWKAHFGIKERQSEKGVLPDTVITRPLQTIPANQHPKHCAACQKIITSQKVIDYCKNNPARFNNKLYCYACQHNIR